MKVGNIVAENSLMGLAQAITPNTSANANTGFDKCIQQSMGQQSDAAAAKPIAKVKDGVIVSDSVKPNVAENSDAANANMTMSDTSGAGMQNADAEVSAEQLDAVNQQIKDVIKAVMNQDDETIEAIMAELAIVPLDLLQTENLQQFVLLADGGQEATDLLLNEQMMADFNMLSEMLQDLDFSEITDAPMEHLVQQMQIVMEPLSEEISDLMPEMMSAGQDETVDADLIMSDLADAENEVPQTEQPVLVTNENPKPVLSKAPVDGAGAEAQPVKDEPEMIVTVSESDSQSQGFANQEATEELWDAELQSESSGPQEQEVEIPVLVNHFEQAIHAANEVSEPQPMTPQMVQIVEQIVEQIRMNVQSDTTSMEMQLNPESLGKVLLTITAKAGVMTANFTVQSEEARAALESQMYTLRENLEQKELKVDAVEVTVSNFDFTQAGNGDEDQKNMDQGDGRSRRYRVEESDDEESDELTAEQEAERVRRNVMRDNGSSIDFTA